tara:strand:+ start:2321 stop:3565 length:1245 start_codon:yes stop_codon:yes gene_type:complete
LNNKPEKRVNESSEQDFLPFIEQLISHTTRRINEGSNTDWGIPPRDQIKDDVITFGGGIPDPTYLPQKNFFDAFQYIQEFPDDTFFRYGGPVGYEKLRLELATFYSKNSVSYKQDQFILTNGSAGAIELISKTIIDPGDIVIAESPTFSGTLRTFRGYGANVLPVEIDSDGMNIEHLEYLLANNQSKKIKLVYTISNFHNPTGAYLSYERRKHLIALSRKHNFLILDDDAYGEINFTNGSVAPLRDLDSFGNVITAGTFSKTIATGMRVGWICAHEDLAKNILSNRFDMGNSPILHGLISHFMASGAYMEHILKMRGIYEKKLNTLIDSISVEAKKHLDFFVPRGGFFLWLRLKKHSAKDLQKVALNKGLIFPHGSVFFVEDVFHDDYIRLAFSKNSTDELHRGGIILSECLTA